MCLVYWFSSANPSKVYSQACQKCVKLWPQFIDTIMKVSDALLFHCSIVSLFYLYWQSANNEVLWTMRNPEQYLDFEFLPLSHPLLAPVTVLPMPGQFPAIFSCISCQIFSSVHVWPRRVPTSHSSSWYTLIVDSAIQVGQMQLLRRQIANELNFSCKFDSKHFESSLNTLNQ